MRSIHFIYPYLHFSDEVRGGESAQSRGITTISGSGLGYQPGPGHAHQNLGSAHLPHFPAPQMTGQVAQPQVVISQSRLTAQYSDHCPITGELQWPCALLRPRGHSGALTARPAPQGREGGPQPRGQTQARGAGQPQAGRLQPRLHGELELKPGLGLQLRLHSLIQW